MEFRVGIEEFQAFPTVRGRHGDGEGCGAGGTPDPGGQLGHRPRGQVIPTWNVGIWNSGGSGDTQAIPTWIQRDWEFQGDIQVF